MTLDDGTVIHTREPARGRVGIAVYPWEVAVTAARPDGDVNVITGQIGTVTHDRGRLRVRVGPLLAEVEALDGLEPGALAHAAFAPASTRVVTL